MNEDYEKINSDDPTALTEEDLRILQKRNITIRDVEDVLQAQDEREALAFGMRAPELALKFILAALLVISGIIIAIITAISVIGIFFGAVFVIAGIALPFMKIGTTGESTAK